MNITFKDCYWFNDHTFFGPTDVKNVYVLGRLTGPGSCVPLITMSGGQASVERFMVALQEGYDFVFGGEEVKSAEVSKDDHPLAAHLVDEINMLVGDDPPEHKGGN